MANSAPVAFVVDLLFELRAQGAFLHSSLFYASALIVLIILAFLSLLSRSALP